MLVLRLRFLPDHRVAGSTEGADGTAQISGYLGFRTWWPKISLISQEDILEINIQGGAPSR